MKNLGIDIGDVDMAVHAGILSDRLQVLMTQAIKDLDTPHLETFLYEELAVFAIQHVMDLADDTNPNRAKTVRNSLLNRLRNINMLASLALEDPKKGDSNE